jgi:hypothetical protein
MAGLKVKIGADASQFERTMRGVRRDIGGVKSAVLGVGAAVGGILAVNKAFDGMRVAARGAFEFIKSSSDEAAGIESLTMQFETLLGGVGEAQERMEEITRFAATTPFEIKELAATSKLLQTLGGDMLATGQGLRLVGDAAAIAGQPIGEVGIHIGRLFNAITSGTSAGESVARLQELGLIGGDVKREFEELAKAQKKGSRDALSQAEAMELLQGVMSKTEGAMERLSTTTEGKLSNMKDNVDQLKVAFGTGFNDGLKDALDATNEFLPQLQEKFKTAGQILGSAISEAVEGNSQIFMEIGLLIGEIVKQGFLAGIQGIGETAAQPLLKGLKGTQLGVIARGVTFGKSDEFIDRQADLIGEGSRIGARENMANIIAEAQARFERIRNLSDESRFNRGLSTSQGTGIISPLGREYRQEELDLLRQINHKLTPQPGN